MSNSSNNGDNRYMAVDREIYKEVDDFSAEVLDGDELLKYVEARRGFFNNPKKQYRNILYLEKLKKTL